VRGERLLAATGRRSRVDGIWLETVGVEADPWDRVDQYLRAGERI
jgi:pyruvate/2-oxoglutarate dehydrogenase complex dihydrolipoamide dehydrogenase (E3) component